MSLLILFWCVCITEALENSTKTKPELVLFNLITLPTRPTTEQMDIVLRSHEKCSGPICKKKTSDSKFPTKNIETLGCCTKCSCAEDCHRYDRCCPDLMERLPKKEEWEERLYECKKAQLKDSSVSPISWKRYWMVSKCPKTFNDTAVINTFVESSNATNLKLNVPVTDIERKITYRNRDNAICHNVDEENLKEWQSEVRCLSGSLRLSTMSIVEAIRNSDDCDMVFKPPLNVEVDECEDVISDCNVTGLWSQHDQVTEAACHAFTSVFNTLYRNIFCFFCNGSPDADRGCTQKSRNFTPVAFSAVLDLDIVSDEKMESTDNGHCTANEIYDQIKMICRQVVCMEGMSKRNGSCGCVYLTATGICYEVFIRFTPLNISFDPENFASSLYSNLVIPFRNNTSYIDQLEIYVENLTVTTYRHFFVRSVLNMKDTHHPQSLIDEFLSQDNLTITFTKGLFSYVQFLVNLDKITVLNGSLISSNNGLPLNKVSVILTAPSCSNMNIVQITNFLRCPLIQLTNYGDGDIIRNVTGLYFRDLKLWFTNKEFVDNKYSDSIFTCAKDYVVKVSQLVETARQDSAQTNDSVSTPVIVSVLVIVMSLICLCMSLVTYCLFEKLRTQPGKNNMGLCITLIIAYLAQFGMGATNVDLLCKVIGSLIHFSWVCVLFWTSVCCYHMYKSMATLTQINATKSGKHLIIKYELFVLISSGLLVLINVVVSLANSNGKNFGYGGVVCFINSKLMLGLTFALVIGIVLVVNFGFFLAIIIKIRKIPKLEARIKNDGNYFKMYARLSSITGFAWIFVLIYLFTKNTIFVYLFIIFGAGQGVFIFFAFTFNRRTYNLYVQYMRKKCPNPDMNQLSVLESNRTQASQTTSKCSKIKL